jgi:hypothetical protein
MHTDFSLHFSMMTKERRKLTKTPSPDTFKNQRRKSRQTTTETKPMRLIASSKKL